MTRERTPPVRRVLMTADTVGGVWTYAMELARALGADGVHVTLATMGAPASAAQRREAAALGNVALHESTFRLEWQDDPWADVDRAGEWLLALEREQRPDVVHLNGYAHGSLPWRAPVLVVAHSCVCSWWEAVKGEPAPAAWDVYRRRVAEGLAAARMVVAPSHAMLRALQRHYGALPRTRVVPNGRDASLFAPLPKERFVLAAGRLWDEAKNIAALARVAERTPWPVVVAGDYASPDGHRQRLRHVRALGRLDHESLADWLGRASVYALPARYEPFGLSIVEAALAGCALVLGDIDSLREVWGDAATFVPPDDDAALARALRWLSDDDHLRREQGRRARARAFALSPERMADGYLGVYATLRAERGSNGVRRASGESAEVVACAS